MLADFVAEVGCGGYPILAQPFFNPLTNSPGSKLVGYPGFVAGSIAVNESSPCSAARNKRPGQRHLFYRRKNIRARNSLTKRRSRVTKTKISNVDLLWIFTEKLRSFEDCPSRITIAIVPDSKTGWSAVASQSYLRRNSLCRQRVEAVQKQLRGIYRLTD